MVWYQVSLDERWIEGIKDKDLVVLSRVRKVWPVEAVSNVLLIID